MQIVDKEIPRELLLKMQENFFGDMVKAVVDIRRGLIAVDGELHADLEKTLLEDGSSQGDLWGINIYPELGGEDMVEFDSIINIRPYLDNPSRDILSPALRAEILSLVEKRII